MRSSLSRYVVLMKRWIWVIVLGIVICSSMTYIVSKILPPTYQASVQLMLTIGTSQSAYDNTSAALELLPTYSQLITNPHVLAPVATRYGLTTQQLTNMIAVKPQSNTQIIEVDVSSDNPAQAANIANAIAQNFAQYSSRGLNGMAQVQILPAQPPTLPLRPRPAQDALIGALVGLGLALAMIVVFEWMDDRLTEPEQLCALTGQDALVLIPELSKQQRTKSIGELPVLAESCRILCAHMNMFQARHPFKVLMVTSALAGEGKSTIAANIAASLALSGKRVLLIDADLRHPMLDQHFQLPNQEGLSNTFVEMEPQTRGEIEGQPTEISLLRVLTAGTPPANPTALLQSPLSEHLFKQLRTTHQFDYVIVDTPPLLPIADSQILASYIDTTLLIVNTAKTSSKAISQALQTLRRTETTVIGIVLNKSPWPTYSGIQEYLSSLPEQQRTENHNTPSGELDSEKKSHDELTKKI